MIQLGCIAFASSDLHVLVAVGGSPEVDKKSLKCLWSLCMVAFPCPLGVG